MILDNYASLQLRFFRIALLHNFSSWQLHFWLLFLINGFLNNFLNKGFFTILQWNSLSELFLIAHLHHFTSLNLNVFQVGIFGICQSNHHHLPKYKFISIRYVWYLLKESYCTTCLILFIILLSRSSPGMHLLESAYQTF